MSRKKNIKNKREENYKQVIPVTTRPTTRPTKKIRVLNSGYGNYGGSKNKNSMKGWNSSGGDSIKDIHIPLPVLRERSRDLYMGAPIATGAIKTVATNVIGPGLRLKPNINKAILGISTDECKKLEEQILNEFSMWANSKVDNTGLLNFYSIQELAFLSMLLSGEVFAAFPFEETPDNPYGLKIQLIEADRVCNEKSKKNSDTLIDGVELNSNGRVKGYHIADKHPLGQKNDYKTKLISIYGKETLRRNIIHLLTIERPGQLRGIPFIAAVIEKIKQLDRYTDAELVAAVVAGLFTVFIENDKIQTGGALDGLTNISDVDKIDSSDSNIELGNGAIWELEEGQKIKETNPGRPNTAFDGFTKSIIEQIGTGLEVPFELLLKHFSSSYSASRASLLEAGKVFRKKRDWFGRNFCQVVYEEWLREAVLRGRINLPKYSDDPIFRHAYAQAEWIGPSQGQIDPLKEANAAGKRIEFGLSTRDKEAMEMNGSDAQLNIAQNIKDNELLNNIEEVISE